jgi:hypothetical protein
MPVISVKVGKDLKKGMEEISKDISWAEEIRKFIRAKIENERMAVNAKMANDILKSVPRLKKGTARKMVREDRDGHT